ncbi:MAG: hypothetical protein ACOY3L_02390 [Pseudomonadota bacterium]
MPASSSPLSDHFAREAGFVGCLGPQAALPGTGSDAAIGILSRSGRPEFAMSNARSPAGSIIGALAAAAISAAFPSGKAHGADLAPNPEGQFDNLPGIGATYTYQEGDTDQDGNADFRVVIDGDPITAQNQGQSPAHRFIDNANKQWTATVQITTRNRAPNNIDSIEINLSKLQHLVAPQGHPEQGAGGMPPGKIFGTDAAFGDVNPDRNIKFSRFYSEKIRHGGGKDPHTDVFQARYSQEVGAKPCQLCRDIEDWSLFLFGEHIAKPPSKVDVNKEITIVEQIFKTKTVTLDVVVDVVTTTATESHAIAAVSNAGNSFDLGSSTGDLRSWEWSSAVEGNSGITAFNEDVGVLSNQGLLLAVGELADLGNLPPGAGSLTDSQSAAEQSLEANFVDLAGGVIGGGDEVAAISSNPATAIAGTIEDSISDNTGVTGVNLNGGFVNNQTHTLSLALSLVPGVALSDAELDQSITGSELVGGNGTHATTTQDSLNGNSGITVVNHSAGTLGNQATVISFAGQADFQ